MIELALTLLATAAAPVLDRLLRHRPRVESFADGAIQVIVGGVVLVHVLPFGIANAGWWALLALLGGAVAGSAAHRLPGGERAATALAVVSLALHGLVDGASLASDHDHGELLAQAVVLHTLPLALATWRIGLHNGGARAAGLLLAAPAAATVVGFLLAAPVLSAAAAPSLGLIQCVLAGALLHVLGHLGDGLPRRPAGWGALVGVAAVWQLSRSHPLPLSLPDELSALGTFGALLAAIAPALLVGYAAAGALSLLNPARFGAWLANRNPVVGVFGGALIGSAVPVVGCGALPMYRSLLARGAPGAAAIAFLVAGPEVGIGTFLVGVPLLGMEMSLLRLGAAVVLAAAVAAIVGPGLSAPRTPAAAQPAESMRTRLERALRVGFADTVEHTAPWILAGLGVASLVEPMLARQTLSGAEGVLAVVVAGVVGIPTYVCAAGATPLVAVLLHKGVSTGAALTFLLVGPATNIATFATLRKLHGASTPWRFGLAVLSLSIGAGLAVNAWGPTLSVPALHPSGDWTPGTLQWIAGGAVLLLFARALVNAGPEGFLEPLLHAHYGHGHRGSGGCEDPHCGEPAVRVARVSSLQTGQIRVRTRPR